MSIKEETEIIFHQDRDNDESNKARHYDNETTWTVESYNAKTTRRMIEMGAPTKPSKACPVRIDGHLFIVDAKQLIEFIASSSGLVVEFRKHKKRQYSEETKAALRERLAVLRQQQTV